MLKIQEIRELIKLIDQSNIDEFSYEYDGAKIKMKKKTAEVITVPQVKQTDKGSHVQESIQQPTVAKQETSQPLIESDNVIETKASNLHTIVSPMVGTFYQASSPDVPPYVKVGTKVSKDSIVCIVEAMKLFNEIEAEVNGEVVEVLVKDGQLVEYGQPLFLVKPE